MSARFVRSLAAMPLVVGVFSGAASAQFVQLDFSAQFNMPRDAEFLANGDTFPYGMNERLGVPFNMGGTADPSDLWGWNAYFAVTGGEAVLTVPVNEYGVTRVYSLINTYWGAAGPDSFASITFDATGGLSWTKDLVGNEDIRDYNQAVWTNSINGTTTREWFNNGIGQRLDMQQYDLPAAFASETLVSITIRDIGEAFFQRSFVTGLTVEIPSPGAGAMLVLAGTLGLRRRRS